MNRRLTQFYYTLHTYPVQIDCNFTTSHSAASGITGLVGAGISAVYTSTSGSSPITPAMADGDFLVQFQDCYNGLYAFDYSLQSSLSGTPIVVTAAGAHLVAGTVYVITVLGTTTAANWVTIGVPIGITPAVGVSFVAAATGAGTGSGQVQIPAAAGTGITNIDILGNPNLTLQSSAAKIGGGGSGAYMLLRTLGPTAAGNTAPVATIPNNGTKIFLKFLLSNSRITNGGD